MSNSNLSSSSSLALSPRRLSRRDSYRVYSSSSVISTQSAFVAQVSYEATLPKESSAQGTP